MRRPSFLFVFSHTFPFWFSNTKDDTFIFYVFAFWPFVSLPSAPEAYAVQKCTVHTKHRMYNVWVCEKVSNAYIFDAVCGFRFYEFQKNHVLYVFRSIPKNRYFHFSRLFLDFKHLAERNSISGLAEMRRWGGLSFFLCFLTPFLIDFLIQKMTHLSFMFLRFGPLWVYLVLPKRFLWFVCVNSEALD
jgi:hypothetical protein